MRRSKRIEMIKGKMPINTIGTGKRQAGIIGIFPVLVMLLVWAFGGAVPSHADEAIVPGTIDNLCTYTEFFYNFPPEDFFYHLNDRLLFMEKPDGIILEKGLRNKILKITRTHQKIKKSLNRFKYVDNTIRVETGDKKKPKKLAQLIGMMGFSLNSSKSWRQAQARPRPGRARFVRGGGKPPAKSKQNKPPVMSKRGKYRYMLVKKKSNLHFDYPAYVGLKARSIEKQLNRNGALQLPFRETRITIPWKYSFLEKITGMEINADNFFENMLQNERFSLLIAVLYRLSHREVDFIAGLVPGEPMKAWKRIYDDKLFLMGMFILSDGLRVTGDGKWLLPGGPEAAPFWNKLAGADSSKEPLKFLRALAVKDKGKLNYLYLFSNFLSSETKKMLFAGSSAEEMQRIYNYLYLVESEKLSKSNFPRLRSSNFYTLMYALQVHGKKYGFPSGLAKWLKVVKNSVNPNDF
ncbi:MAG: hypothetical protein GY765_38960 [bacterium]|nr:hypothetical protein [bacterium]